PVALGELRDALDVLRLDRAGESLAGEVLGVVFRQRPEVPALEAARVDEGLDAPELPRGVDAVQGEGCPAAATHRARHREVPRDLAARLRIRLVDRRERQAEDEVRDLAGRLVLKTAGLGIEIVLPGVLVGRVPERLAVVVMEAGRVD